MAQSFYIYVCIQAIIRASQFCHAKERTSFQWCGTGANNSLPRKGPHFNGVERAPITLHQAWVKFTSAPDEEASSFVEGNFCQTRCFTCQMVLVMLYDQSTRAASNSKELVKNVPKSGLCFIYRYFLDLSTGAVSPIVFSVIPIQCQWQSCVECEDGVSKHQYS